MLIAWQVAAMQQNQRAGGVAFIAAVAVVGHHDPSLWSVTASVTADNSCPCAPSTPPSATPHCNRTRGPWGYPQGMLCLLPLLPLLMTLLCHCCHHQVVSNHISQLRPYLACAKAHTLRGALLAATGSVLLQVGQGV